MIYAFAAALAVGAIGTATCAGLWRAAQAKLAAEKSAHESTRANLLATQMGLEVSEQGRLGESARLEAIITAQKVELQEMMKHQSSDPLDLRGRLEKLSGG